MKHLKIYVIALLSLIASPGLLHAQAMTAGKVQAFIVQGDVQLVAADGTTQPLQRGQIFEEGSIVKAGQTGQALLVFSNGATMKVMANCQLAVTKFQQAPFDEGAEGTFLRLSKDPSKSTTTLDLRNGTLQGEVKQLDLSAGSSFNVNTPAGSAGIRGTIVDISVVRNAAGQIVGITCNCIVGNMAFTPSTSIAAGTGAGTTTTATNTNVSNVSVGSGASLQVQLTVDPTTGLITGGAISGSAMATATAQALADALVETINTAKTQAGLAAQPPPVVNVTQAPVATNSNGTTTTVTQNTAVTLTATSQTQASGTATTYSSSPIVTVNTTTTTNTGTTTTPSSVNTNPSTVSGS